MSENGSESLPFEPPEQENIRLREENARLRRLLAVHSILVPQFAAETLLPAQAVETAVPVNKEERARKRIALFRGLFRGREDVYARRWENADGRHGYSPAAVKDWKAIRESRPEERKKVDQKTRRLLPLTDAVIENHLLGTETVGVYPLLPDETCWYLAADFDKKTWELCVARTGSVVCARLRNGGSARLLTPSRIETGRFGHGPEHVGASAKRAGHPKPVSPPTAMQLGAKHSDDATRPGGRAKSPWRCNPASVRLGDLPVYPFPRNRESGPDDGTGRNPEADAKGDAR